MRGEGFGEAHAFIARLLPLFPGHVWPQTVRMNLNEAEMEAFYKRWKNEAGRVIIQKHNDFGGRLPRAKPSDLSPWKRHACWHLARDLAVFLDGTVVVCHDDFARTMPLGNAWTEPWDVIWERGTALYGRHLKEDWPEVCRNCDEWYTFHFLRSTPSPAAAASPAGSIRPFPSSSWPEGRGCSVSEQALRPSFHGHGFSEMLFVEDGRPRSRRPHPARQVSPTFVF